MPDYPLRTSLPMDDEIEPWTHHQSRSMVVESPQLLLQCEDGTKVPLTVVPNPGRGLSFKLLVPDARCGFGVVSFPKPPNTPTHRRLSSTFATDNLSNASSECKISPSPDNQHFNKTHSVDRTYRTQSIASTSHVSTQSSVAIGKSKKIVSFQFHTFQ